MPLLGRDFFLRDVESVARALVGRELRHGRVSLRITEVEAYGHDDTASHARFGSTSRTAPMFEEGGALYVYLCYGIHQMVNVVADEEGTGSAVLIRSCEVVRGLDVVRARRGGKSGPALLTGPGKVGQALAVDVGQSGQRLDRRGGVTLHPGSLARALLCGPRIGIDYADSADRRRAWRFAMEGTAWVSHRAGLS